MDTSGQPDDFAPPPLAFPVVASSPPNNSPPSMSVSRSGDIKSKATNIPQDDDESTDLGSRSATKGPTRPPYDSADERKPAGEAASDGRRSDVAAAGATLPHASRPDTCADADHDTARSADNNQILLPAISAAVSKTHSAIALRGASSELDIKLDIQSPLGQPGARTDNTEVVPVHDINLNRALSTSPMELSSPPLPAITPPLSQNVHTRTSQDAVDIPFGPSKAAEPGETGRSPSQVDPLGDGNLTKPLAQQVDHTASEQPFPKPVPSVSSSKRRGISIPSSISRAASVLTMIVPSRKGTAREELPVESHVLSEPSSHPRDEDKGKSYANEERPPSPRGRTTSTAESLSLPLPVFGPHLWDEIYSSIRGHEGVDREANGTAVGPTLAQERKQVVTALDERETNAEDTDAILDGSQRRPGMAEPNPSSDPKRPVLSPTQRQPNDDTRVPSSDDSTSQNVHTPPQPRAVPCPDPPAVLSAREEKGETGPDPDPDPDIPPSTEIPLLPITIQPGTHQERPSVHPRSSPLGDGNAEPEPEQQRGQSGGGDVKPGDGRTTKDERIREAGRPESRSQSMHPVLRFCYYLCSCGPPRGS